MLIKQLFIIMLVGFLGSCSRETPRTALSNPGFGVVETRISAGSDMLELPVILQTDQEIKGIQFTLTWDTAAVGVGQPRLTDSNPGFTVSTGKSVGGRMKVLVFSMTGGVLNVQEPEILTIPVNLIDPEITEVFIRFEHAVFAGPNAASYHIPVTHARLKVVK